MKTTEPSFPLVAIGASAGGLEAVSEFLTNLSYPTGMAFIYVQHLNPDYPSNLVPLLSRKTKMKVLEAEDMDEILPDHFYVIPNNKSIKATDGHIKLLPRLINGNPVSIDVLFSSIARMGKQKIIGIVLSGNASDGSQGIKAIKKAGGITFAQDNTAKFSSMPQSAIETGAVDMVLSPKEIAKELMRLSKNRFLSTMKGNHILKKITNLDNVHFQHPGLKIIFTVLQNITGTDFSLFKINTLKRRINRRMAEHKIKKLNDYAKLVKHDNIEAMALYNDLLIPVTGFFRDKEVFDFIRSLLPRILEQKKKDETLRIWVPACSTGEEAYSIAMIVSELMDKYPRKLPVRVFATDLNENAIRFARAGEFSKGKIDSLSEETKNRFFTKANGKYQISQQLREICVFARHNMLNDPPFSRMDFVSCRNMLIYFNAAAQKKALARIHFALNDKGFLLLGKAENIGTATNFFTPFNNKFKIFQKKSAGTRKTVVDNGLFLPGPKAASKISDRRIKKQASKFQSGSEKLEKAVDDFLLSRYMPAAAIINRDMEILEFRGSTSFFLSHPGGKASLNILKMVRADFAFELRSIILKAFKTNKTVKKSGIELKIDGTYQTVSIDVTPLKIYWDEPLFLIVFVKQEWVEHFVDTDSKKNSLSQKDKKIKKLSEELNNMRAEMHGVFEMQENAQKELQNANEEIVSNNEELQTLNEELETSKEEIESTNEELISANQELQTRNELLSESYEYSKSILENIHEPMIILDDNFIVKSANKSFFKKFLVSEEETIGISLFDLGNRQWDIPKLHTLLEDILAKNHDFHNYEIAHIFPKIGYKIMLLNAKQLIQKVHNEKLIMLAMEDVTERVQKSQEEKAVLRTDIQEYKADKLVLEKDVMRRVKEIEKKNIELQRVNKELETLTFVSSHDLQEPLRKIKTFANLILDEEHGKISKNGLMYLHRMQETVMRMQMLLNDLLSYFRVKNGEHNFEKTDLNFIVKETIHDFKFIIKEKKAVVITGSLCKADVIRFQFRQLLNNLLSNALKFSHPKKKPRISIKSEMATGKKFKNDHLSPTIEYCHLMVKDNGIGFEAQYKERIFEVFQRLHEYENYAGSGIGLAICKRIVENHGGIITASGRLNKGARFDVYLPIDQIS